MLNSIAQPCCCCRVPVNGLPGLPHGMQRSMRHPLAEAAMLALLMTSYY